MDSILDSELLAFVGCGLAGITVSSLVCACYILVGKWRKRRLLARHMRRLDDLRQMPMDEEQLNLLRQNVGLYNVMPEPLQRELQARTLLLLENLDVQGANGFKVDEEMRVTICALVCLPLLGREEPLYLNLTRVIVHASDIVDADSEAWGGMAHPSGVIELSWPYTADGHATFRDGYNVVFHELAHLLDFEDEGQGYGYFSPGRPLLRVTTPANKKLADSWQSLLEAEHLRLIEDEKAGRSTVMRTYGTTDLRETFAVATETFFELPHDLKEHHAKLYDALKTFYGLDPAAWTRG